MRRQISLYYNMRETKEYDWYMYAVWYMYMYLVLVYVWSDVEVTPMYKTHF